MRTSRLCVFCLALGVSLSALAAKEPDAVDIAIDRGLEYLLGSQKDDGSFHGQFGDTVAVPALASMACLATGHVPGDAKYGRLIDKSLDYVLANHDETGYFGAKGNGRMYAHSIATLFLTEVSGMAPTPSPRCFSLRFREWSPRNARRRSTRFCRRRSR